MEKYEEQKATHLPCIQFVHVCQWNWHLLLGDYTRAVKVVVNFTFVWEEEPLGGPVGSGVGFQEQNVEGEHNQALKASLWDFEAKPISLSCCGEVAHNNKLVFPQV